MFHLTSTQQLHSSSLTLADMLFKSTCVSQKKTKKKKLRLHLCLMTFIQLHVFLSNTNFDSYNSQHLPVHLLFSRPFSISPSRLEYYLVFINHQHHYWVSLNQTWKYIAARTSNSINISFSRGVHTHTHCI